MGSGYFASGEVRRLPSSCRATIGVLGNSEHSSIVIGKAGRNRWKGIRPRFVVLP